MTWPQCVIYYAYIALSKLYIYETLKVVDVEFLFVN